MQLLKVKRILRTLWSIPFKGCDSAACFVNRFCILSRIWSKRRPWLHPDTFQRPYNQAIAKAHGKSSAQIIIRWHLQAGNIAIPGSSIEKKIGTVHSVVERWLKLYKYNGIESLKIKDYNQQYDDDLKSKVIEQVTVQNIPYTRVAAMNNLSPSTVKRWVIESTKGLKLNGKKNLITSEEAAAIREKFKHVKDPEIRKIMEKNYWLEMENEALKKLEALTQNQQEKKQ